MEQQHDKIEKPVWCRLLETTAAKVKALRNAWKESWDKMFPSIPWDRLEFLLARRADRKLTETEMFELFQWNVKLDVWKEHPFDAIDEAERHKYALKYEEEVRMLRNGKHPGVDYSDREPNQLPATDQEIGSLLKKLCQF